MSQTAKVHRIQVRRKPASEGSTIQTGANTEVLIDGQPFRGITFLKFEVKAKGVAKCTIELFADLDIDAELYPDIKVAKEEATHELSKYSPSKIR